MFVTSVLFGFRGLFSGGEAHRSSLLYLPFFSVVAGFIAPGHLILRSNEDRAPFRIVNIILEDSLQILVAGTFLVKYCWDWLAILSLFGSCSMLIIEMVKLSQQLLH